MLTSSNIRIIKKYQNRRLYDTEDSIYITLSEVRELVMNSVDFIVQDAKTKEDITRQVLLGIILEEEAGGGPLFSNQLLRQIISFYGHAFQSAFGHFLESNIRGFSEAQEQFQNHMQKLMPEGDKIMPQIPSPMIATNQMQNLFTPYLENSKMMFEMITDSFRGMSKPTPQNEPSTPPPTKKEFGASSTSHQTKNFKTSSPLKKQKTKSQKTLKNTPKTPKKNSLKK